MIDFLRKIPIIAFFACCQVFGGWVAAQESTDSEAAEPIKFDQIITKKGVEYKDCEVIRSEPDALIFKHGNGTGIARVSFFDLSYEIQKQFRFDPVAGMKKYHSDKSSQRRLRWSLFWENQKVLIEQKEATQKIQLHHAARTTWLPISARFLKKTNEGAFVRASHVRMVATKETSALGFEVDGPPIKKLVPFKEQVIFLVLPAKDMKKSPWVGYLEPSPHGAATHEAYPGKLIPKFRAIARSEIHD